MTQTDELIYTRERGRGNPREREREREREEGAGGVGGKGAKFKKKAGNCICDPSIFIFAPSADFTDVLCIDGSVLCC